MRKRSTIEFVLPGAEGAGIEGPQLMASTAQLGALAAWVLMIGEAVQDVKGKSSLLFEVLQSTRCLIDEALGYLCVISTSAQII